ncbi:MAG: Mu transposase C-terminal domain-containing protein, partial [Acidobacteriota bacterium]
KPRLTLAEFDGLFRTFLLDVYHRRECSETKTPPVEGWEAKGFLPRMPDSLEQLDLLLIQVARARQVRVDGIHFQSLRYISTTLAAYVGETVTLRFDPRDMAEIRVFHEDKFLCRAVCAELAGATVSSSRNSPCSQSDRLRRLYTAPFCGGYLSINCSPGVLRRTFETRRCPVIMA